MCSACNLELGESREHTVNYCCRKLAFVMSVNLHPDQMSGEKPDYRDTFNQTQLLTEVSLLLRFLKIGSFRHLKGRFLKKYCLALNRSVAPMTAALPDRLDYLILIRCRVMISSTHTSHRVEANFPLQFFLDLPQCHHRLTRSFV